MELTGNISMWYLPGDAKVINAARYDLIYSLLFCDVALTAMHFCELAGSLGENNTICRRSILGHFSAISIPKKKWLKSFKAKLVTRNIVK